MNELSKLEFDGIVSIKVTSVGELEFKGYEQLKEEVKKLDSILEQVEVDKENIKLAKKLVAKVRKKSDELDEERKSVKKELLKPYEDVESKVKEITNLIKQAENKVRIQIKQLEEKERQEKLETIKDIWDRRTETFEYSFIEFDRWFQDSFLNKSTSIKQIESDLENFLMKVENDMRAISCMPELDVYLETYIETYDLAYTLRTVKEKIEAREQLESIKKELKHEDIKEIKEKLTDRFEKVVIEINKSDCKKVSALLLDNNIEFTISNK